MVAAVLAALVPAALLIGLGAILRRAGFLDETFWPGAERLSYFVLLPALFVHSLATADLAAVPIAGLALAVVPPLLLVAGGLVALRPRLPISDAAFTSVFQGGIRFNNYVGLVLASGLFGAGGLALAAVANALIVPTVNVLCALVFARYGARRTNLLRALPRAVVNPLVLGCLGGVALQVAGLRLSGGVEAFVRALGTAALPLGLLCVGAAFEPSAIGRGRREALVASLAKFALLPAAGGLMVWLSGLQGPPATVAVLFLALPTASSAYIMARQLGGDAPLMAGIVALQTALAAVAVPLAMALFAARSA